MRADPLSAQSGCRGHRSRPTEPRGTAPQRQVRSARRRRSHPGAGRGQALGPSGPGESVDPDASSRIQRSVTAPLPPQSLSLPALVAAGVKLPPTRSPDAVTAATKASLSSLAHRISALGDELTALDERIEALLEATVPSSSDSSAS